MTLDAYLKLDSAPSLTELAEAIGISKGRLSQLRTESDWPPDVAMKAEAVTGGVLNASTLSSIVARARQSGAAA